MNGGQIAMICWLALSIGVGLSEHGKPKTGTNNFWITLLSCAIYVGLLCWGGFWN